MVDLVGIVDDYKKSSRLRMSIATTPVTIIGGLYWWIAPFAIGNSSHSAPAPLSPFLLLMRIIKQSTGYL
jgi:hypothetical protein